MLAVMGVVGGGFWWFVASGVVCAAGLAAETAGLLWSCGGAAEDDLVSVDGVGSGLL